MRRRSGFGWGEFILGAGLILLGIFTFARPHSIFTGLAILYGIAAVVSGISDIVFYIKEARFTGFGPGISLAAGILSMMTGVALLAYPGMGEALVSVLFPLWFITHCVSRLAHLGLIRLVAGRFCYWFSLILNACGLVFGLLMLVRPFLAFFTAGYIFAFCLVALGIECIVLAFSEMGSGW